MLVGLNLDNYTFRLVGTFISKEGVTSSILEYFANTFSGACGAFKILLSTNFLSDGNTLKGKKRRVNKTMKTLIKKVKNLPVSSTLELINPKCLIVFCHGN